MPPSNRRRIIVGRIYRIDTPERYGARGSIFQRVWTISPDADENRPEDLDLSELHEVELSYPDRKRQFVLTPQDVGRVARFEVQSGKHEYIKKVLDQTGMPWRESPAPPPPYLDKPVDVPSSMVDEAAHTAATGEWNSTAWAALHNPDRCKYCHE